MLNVGSFFVLMATMNLIGSAVAKTPEGSNTYLVCSSIWLIIYLIYMVKNRNKHE